MTKNRQNNNNNINKSNSLISDLEKELSQMKEKVNKLEGKNSNLELRVEELETKCKVSENVTSLLVLEVDRLSQYQRRSNVVIRNMFLPENESLERLNNTVVKVIKEELKLPQVVKDIDKFHRIGRVKESNGKKTQNIIVKFKSHSSRYAGYNERKNAKHIKINPNLTKRRGKILYDAVKLTEELPKVNFISSDLHGDLKIRVNEPQDGKNVFLLSQWKS